MIEIADRFDLRERIGGGAAADVYRAFDHELDREVVVRVLRADFATDDEYVERFHHEAEAATGIRHPNVVEVLGHGVVDGRPFVVRELIEGSTLDDVLESRGALPEEEARALAEQVARGLEAAHARGVLHRDLNAGNVFVTSDGIAKVVDFGMPSVPRHPAPEQVEREQIDERVDVYGLGAVLYQMLTGHTPRGRLMPPRRLARVSKRIENVTVRALEKDPARRYPTAAAVADALKPAPVVVPISPRSAAPLAAPVVAASAATPETAAAAAAEAEAREAAAAEAAAREAAAREAAAREAAAAEAAAREAREAAAREASARQAREVAAAEARRVAARRAAAAAIPAAPVVVPIARPRLLSTTASTERIARPVLPTRRRRDSASPFILLVLPLLLALLVAAFALGRPAPTNTAVLSATTTPQATPQHGVFPEPTSLPPVETTPEPTPPEATQAAPPPAPAPTLAPAAPPAAAPPAAVPAPAAPPATSPAASVVRSFYALIDQKRFDEAAALWSPRMQATYPPATNIYGRFDRTRQILIRDIAPVPQNSGGAAVAIDILEVLDSGVTRRWVGQWHLVWDGSRWLMDAPSLRAA